MLMKEKTSKEVSNYALLNSIADSFYTDLIDSIEETDSIVDVFAGVCREITLFVMRDFLYSVFAGTDTGYKHFSNKDAKVSVRDILNAEALLSGDFDCSDHAKALAKEYFDPTILSLLFSLRMTGDRIDDNIDLMESIFDECKGDRTYIKTANAHARDKDMAICRLLRTCYSMTSKEIAKHMGITEAKVYKLTAAWDDSKDGLYVRLYKYLYARIMAMRNRLLDDQEGKIFLRAAKNSRDYISIDTKNTFLEPETMGEEEVDDIIDDFKRKKEIEAMNTRLGVDISKYNGRCNMDLAKESGLSFVILKAGSGYSGEDPYWVRNYNAFMKRVESSGYYVGLYTMKSWLDNSFDMERLKEFDLWVARWSSRGHGYKGPGLVGMWQYTNRGHFKGIGTTSEGGNDANVAYIDYPTIIKKKGLNNYRKKK